MKLKALLISFVHKPKFLTKKEKIGVIIAFVLLTIGVCIRYPSIEASNLEASAVELSYAGIFGFILAKFFFKKEEISINKKELRSKLSQLNTIGLEINAIINLLEDESKQDLSYYKLTLSDEEFLQKEKDVLINMQEADDKIETILEMTRINFIENSSLMPLLKEVKKYLSNSRTGYRRKDFASMGLEISNAILTLGSYEEIINGISKEYKSIFKKL